MHLFLMHLLFFLHHYLFFRIILILFSSLSYSQMHPNGFSIFRYNFDNAPNHVTPTEILVLQDYDLILKKNSPAVQIGNNCQSSIKNAVIYMCGNNCRSYGTRVKNNYKKFHQIVLKKRKYFEF